MDDENAVSTYEYIDDLGTGAFAKVQLCRRVGTDELYVSGRGTGRGDGS